MEQSRPAGDRKGYEDELPRSVLYSGYGFRTDDLTIRHQPSGPGSPGGGSAGCADGIGGGPAWARFNERILVSKTNLS